MARFVRMEKRCWRHDIHSGLYACWINSAVSGLQPQLAANTLAPCRSRASMDTRNSSSSFMWRGRAFSLPKAGQRIRLSRCRVVLYGWNSLSLKCPSNGPGTTLPPKTRTLTEQPSLEAAESWPEPLRTQLAQAAAHVAPPAVASAQSRNFVQQNSFEPSSFQHLSATKSARGTPVQH